MALWTSLRSLWGVHGYQAGPRSVPLQLNLWSLDGVLGSFGGGPIGVFAAFAVGGWRLGPLACLQRGRSGAACAFRCAVLDFKGCTLSDPWWSRKGKQNRLPSTHACHLCCGSGASQVVRWVVGCAWCRLHQTDAKFLGKHLFSVHGALVCEQHISSWASMLFKEWTTATWVTYRFYPSTLAHVTFTCHIRWHSVHHFVSCTDLTQLGGPSVCLQNFPNM